MNSRKLERIALRPFNDILKAAQKICKEWGTNSIPLITLKHIIGIAEKHALEMNLEGDATIIKEKYLIVYNTLYKTCETKAKEMEIQRVSINYLRKCIDVIKTSWKEGGKDEKI